MIPENNNNLLHTEADHLEAYKKVFLQYYKSLCMEAFLILRVEATAEDIVQTVFTNIWKEQSLNNITCNPETYLTTAVRNACFNDLKLKKREQKHMQDYFRKEMIEVKKAFELKELAIHIEKSIESLPLQCRQTFRLIFIQRKKYEEAALILGVSINTVKTQLRRAVIRLREIMYDFLE